MNPTCEHKKHHAARQCQACYDASRGRRLRNPDVLPAAGNSYTEEGNRAVKAVESEVEIKTLDVMLKTCEVDLSTWEVEKWICNNWAHKWQVKVWLRRKVEIVAARAEIEALVKAAKTRIPARPRRSTFANHEHALEVNIPDLHLGKLAWDKETGHGDYDISIAEQVFRAAVERLLDRTSGYTFNEVLFPIGSDFLNIDNLSAQTTRGTPQDVDSRFPKMFAAARALLCWAVDRLRAVAPVKVKTVPGNHDQLSSWHLGHSLECFFHNTPDVEVDNAPTQRKYYEFGNTMLLLAHGDKGKLVDYPALMAAEQPAMWGRTRFHEAHVGHLHQTRVQEKFGARVRILSALCAADSWHAANGYIGNLRSAEAFVWHAEDGLVGQAYYTVPPE